MLDVQIDRLTNSIEEVATGEKLDTEVLRASRKDLKALGPKWRFNWIEEQSRSEIYKLIVPARDGTIQGVISLSREADHVFVHLIENHPQNVGRNKLFSGVAGNLFAYAAKLAFDLEHDGFVCFVAKTELIEHYRKTLGATRIGRSQRMFLDTVAAQKLIRSYYGE